MTRFDDIRTPTSFNALVSFTSLAGFNKRFVLAGDDQTVYDSMNAYFSWAGALIQKAGGTVIKCIGDAMLVVFPIEAADAGALALRELKSSGDAWLKSRNIPCNHYIKAHVGPVIAGPIGAPGHERLDVYGKTVNICATLESNGIVITPQLFRALNSETRKLFKKHTPPVTYIRVEDAHS